VTAPSELRCRGAHYVRAATTGVVEKRLESGEPPPHRPGDLVTVGEWGTTASFRARVKSCLIHREPKQRAVWRITVERVDG
jgi:hypothetical protein